MTQTGTVKQCCHGQPRRTAGARLARRSRTFPLPGRRPVSRVSGRGGDHRARHIRLEKLLGLGVVEGQNHLPCSHATRGGKHKSVAFTYRTERRPLPWTHLVHWRGLAGDIWARKYPSRNDRQSGAHAALQARHASLQSGHATVCKHIRAPQNALLHRLHGASLAAQGCDPRCQQPALRDRARGEYNQLHPPPSPTKFLLPPPSHAGCACARLTQQTIE